MNDYMIAARLYGRDDMRVERVPVPKPGPGELLLRVRAAAVCGTDLRMLKNGAPGVDESHPLICCHEFAGVIEAVGANIAAPGTRSGTSGSHAGTAGAAPGAETDAGAGADQDSTASADAGAGADPDPAAGDGAEGAAPGQCAGYRAGMRVSVAPNIGCGVCDRCASGNSHHCVRLRALGVHADGGFAEYVLIPADAVRLGNVSVLDPSISFEAAAANEALSCVYNAFERYRVNPGETVAIIGAGAIGLMHAKLAKLAGAAQIIMSDLSAERLQLCASAEPSLIAAHGDIKQTVAAATAGEGANVVITACGSASAQQDALEIAAHDGRVNFFGGLPKGKEAVSLDTNLIHYKQLTVTGTTRASHAHYRRTLGMLARGRIDLAPLLTDRFPIEDIGAAFDNAHSARGLKQVIIF